MNTLSDSKAKANQMLRLMEQGEADILNNRLMSQIEVFKNLREKLVQMNEINASPEIT